jgi:hypothetical protein
MDRAVIFLGICAFILLAGKNKETNDAGVSQSINPILYNRFIQRKGQGLGSRGYWQFVYTNEIYWLLAPIATTVTPAVKDPFLYQIYELSEVVIKKGENNTTFSSTMAGWLQSRFPSLDSDVRTDVLDYEKKLFTVSTKLWTGKVLQ